MNYIALREKDRAVAIRMATSEMNGVNFSAIEVQRQLVLECDHGKRDR